MRVTHLITTLDQAGAEMWLSRLVPALKDLGIQSSVVSLRSTGAVGAQLLAQGIDVRAMGLSISAPRRMLSAVPRVHAVLADLRPHVIQGWMYHGNIMASVGGRATGRPIVWNIRGSRPIGSGVRAATALTALSGAVLSRTSADAIVYCAEAARRAHRRIGYPSGKAVVIHNGVDTLQALPLQASRRQLQLPTDAFLVGRVARFHPLKDFATLLAGASAAKARVPHLHVVFCGIGVTPENRELRALVNGHGMSDSVTLLGVQEDMVAVYSALDVLVSTSVNEGFPNTVAEAMALGVPVVATPAGDACQIMGSVGVVMPFRDPNALAATLVRMAAETPSQRRRTGVASRARIATSFSVEHAAQRYARLYRELCGGD